MSANQKKQHRPLWRPSQRRGAISVLAAFLLIVLMGMVAFSVDVGYVLSAKEELQRSADSAALAASWDYSKQLADGHDTATALSSARGVAAQYAALNVVGNESPEVDAGTSNSNEGDVVFGYISDLYDDNSYFDTSGLNAYNAVRVRVRRDTSLNGEVPLFFARLFGRAGQAIEAEATAAMVRDVWGFQTPHDGSNLNILPFALDLYTYNELLAGNAPDSYSWNTSEGSIEGGSDGMLEMNLYPQGTGSPGNRGTVDIGSNSNSTSDIARQILHGVSPSDMEHHGGKLEFNDNGELFLNGDTGISAGMKDELAQIQGQPRTIPVFMEVNGPGNNAMYTIVKWLGIRVMDVKLTGPMNKKHVTIQVAPVVSPGIIPSTTTGTSNYVYSPAILLR